MAFNYDSLAAAAVRQINDKGRNVTYRAFTSGTYDPTAGTVSGDSTVNTTIKAVITNAKVIKIDNSAIQRGDKFALIAADQITPNEKDRVIDGSETYQIIDVTEIKTGDTPLAYKLLLRK